MGGNATPYLIPAPYTGISTYRAHRNRSTPSSEPGVDYYMPTGTPLGAPARCRVVDIGGGIQPATGRFVTFDDGSRWLRALHLLEWRCRVGDELEGGEIFGLSGASGYGSEFFGEPRRNADFWNRTGGDHVHMTAFVGRRYTFGRDGRGSVDFHALTGGTAAGGSIGDDDMTPDERKMLNECHSMLLETRDYLGARGGHNTQTPNTIGHKVTEIRDYLGAGGAKGNPNEATIGHKINALFAKLVGK